MAELRPPSYPAAVKYQGGVAARYVARREREPTWAWEQGEVERYVESLPSALEVLDVPVGSGRYLPIYLDARWTVHGCDISADMIAVAEEHVGDRVDQCDLVVAPAEHLPMHDRSMDVIVCGRFIQWIPTLDGVEAVVAELARVGRREAFIQLRIPACPREAPSLRGAIRQAARVANRMVRRHTVHRAAGAPASLTAHSEPQLLAVLERQGWRLVSIGPECPSDPGLRFYRFSRRD
jgi:ubiquinone/menaquinone biosynthesis C-methylase UbiE